jgi:restriction system protein
MVASRRNTGILGAIAEAQRRQQRQREAEQRAWRAARQEQQRAERAAARAYARDQREALHAYQQGRDADAAARTSRTEAQVTQIGCILRNVLAAPPFRLEQLIQQVRVPPFNPGPLAVPVAMPQQAAYQVAPPARLRALTPAARKEHQEARRRAQEQFERDCHTGAQMEKRRQRQLADYHRQYQAWAAREREKIIDHNAQVKMIADQMASGAADAICEYFDAMLYASAGWPEDFPRRAKTAWERSENHLLADWELPDFSAIPAISRYRYIKSDDRETQIQRPAGERKALYRNALAQSALAVLAEIFRADHGRLVSTATVNGYVATPDPATGRRSKVFLLTVSAGRHVFTRLDLAKIDPVSCVDGLHGQLSSRPDTLAPVHLPRLATTVPDNTADDSDPGLPDLLDMDPVDFEKLVADLFQAMGMEVMTTARSGDGGVDILAMDPDPIRGGKLIIQVKRGDRSSIPDQTATGPV